MIFIVIHCVFCVLWQEEVWTPTESLRAAAAVFPSSGFWVEQTELKTISYWVQKLKIALMKVLKRNLFFITCSQQTEFFLWTSAAEDPAGADIMRHKDNMTAVVQEDTLRPEDDTSRLSRFQSKRPLSASLVKKLSFLVTFTLQATSPVLQSESCRWAKCWLT